MDALVEQIASLRRETMQRHNDNVKRADERQHDVLIRLDRIEAKQDADSMQIAGLKSITDYLKEEWQLIRKRYHELLNARQSNGDGQGDNTIVRRMDVKTAVAIYIGGIATITAILKMMGKI